METRDKKRIVRIERKKEPLSETATMDKAASDSFWKGKSLDELDREFGAKPFDPATAGKNWPEGADFDKFMAAINEGREYPGEW